MSQEITRRHPDYNSLPTTEMRALARRLTKEGQNAGKQTILGVWNWGRVLTEGKATFPHGFFQDWIRLEFGLKYHTARHFMNVFKKFPDLPQKLNNSTFELSPTVVYMFAEPSVSDETAEVGIDMMLSGDLKTGADAKALFDAAKPPQSTADAPDTPAAPPEVEAQSSADDETLNPSNSTGLESSQSTANTLANTDLKVTDSRPLESAQSTAEDGESDEHETSTDHAKRVKSAPVVYDTLAQNKPIDESTLEPDEWLETLATWRVLKTLPHRGVLARHTLLAYRASQKTLKALAGAWANCSDTKSLDANDPVARVVGKAADLKHPRAWFLCAMCKGGGCGRCGSSGLDPYAGIDATRIKRGEVST